MTSMMLMVTAMICLILILRTLRRRKPPPQFSNTFSPPELTPELVRHALEEVCGPGRSLVASESLTLFEIRWMAWRVEHDLPGCIDCEEGGEMRVFKRDATSLFCHYHCLNEKCGSEFLLSEYRGIVRITNRSPNKPKEMVSLGTYR
jgi:hypothetical protein